MTLKPIRLVAAVVVGVVAAGCADSTKPAFVARADAICDAVAAATQDVTFQLFAVQPTPAELAELIGALLPRLEKGFRDLARLRPPRDDRSAVQAILHLGEAEVARFKAYRARAAARDHNATGDFFNRVPFAAFKAEAGRYGLTHCASERYGGGEKEEGRKAGRSAVFPPDKVAFIAAGEAACQLHSRTPADALYFQNFAYYRDLSADPAKLALWAGMLGPAPGTPGTKGTLIPFFTTAVDALGKHTPPPADRARIASLLDRYRAVGAAAEEAGNLAIRHERSGFRARLASVAALGASADESLADYGFTNCSPADILLVPRVARDTFRLL